MNILITGNISSLALKFASEAGENSKVIIASGKLPKRRLGVNVHTYAASPRDKLFGRVIESNSFDAMVYFLARGEETDVSGGEVSVIGTSIEFAAALEHCRVRNIPRIVLVSSGEVYSGRPNEAALESAAPIPGGVGGCLIKTAEDMCKYYQIAILRSITVVHLPYVYFREPNDFDESKDSLITNIIYDAVSKKSVTLPGYPFTKCDFLSADDAAKLILLTADKRAFSDDVEVVNAGTGSPITFENLERMIKTDYPDVSVNYSNDDTDVPVPMPSESAKTEYDWTALERIDDDFPDMSFYYFKAPHNKGIIAAVKALRSRRTFFAVEFATATVLMQAVVMQFGTSMVSGLIDFRLLYIVILSTLHGIAAGIVSALLAIVSLMFSSLRGDWRTILYNPENWMPFAIYLIVGTVLGYTADKKRDDLANANEQLQI
ncbi:MAG: NAD-dependent epimerase/dehydratase family protein, partial [Oscillospiraceae bacterium]|nr:NAD-dependent epimerase/dehydratase family protein [Oscillospiraceae bacterium]